MKGHLKYEISEVVKFLQHLRFLFPQTKIKFCEGNHEDRLSRYILKNAPALWDFIDMPTLLQLDKLDIEWVPFGRNKKAQRTQVLDALIYARHRPTNGGRHCAASTLSNAHRSVIFGDTHRRQSFTERTLDEVEIEVVSMGWLGDIGSPVYSYMDTTNWAHGFGIVYQFSDDVEDFIIQQVPIKNGQAVYNGFKYGPSNN